LFVQATTLNHKKAIIIGAGPAGLTAAYELLQRTDIIPIVLEKSTHMGGLSRTVNYKGNRIDIGGHRFFSKSDRVMNWWLQHLPLQRGSTPNPQITYHNASRDVPMVETEGGSAEQTEEVMLVRRRKSRIYYLRKLFEYPIQLNLDTLRKMGLVRTARIGLSYVRTVLFPQKQVVSLEQFLINRFGRELYLTFFKSYTEKVWGVPCNQISAEWGEQRIKGLSIGKALLHFLTGLFSRRSGVEQKDVETSLIEQFLYPKYGPGQMWDTVARKVVEMGGEIITGVEVQEIRCQMGAVMSVLALDAKGEERVFTGDYFFSTMPVRELVQAIDVEVPANVREVSEGLMYRDFITVGLLIDQVEGQLGNGTGRVIEDNWIYIQEPEVLAGRLQIFNNWSPYMVAMPQRVWLGVEYFCNETDDLWRKPDAEMAEIAKDELDRIGIIDRNRVLDWTVIRMPKAYPAYFGTYGRFNEIRQYLDGFENLFLVGRNGMHKYNNQDHSMLTAMVAVDNLVSGCTDKSAVWEVNTEMEYHEQK
jgi:protoporphyrinogen oxidase